MYFGANLEPDSASLAATVHAEQSAVVNAILHGESGVEGTPTPTMVWREKTGTLLGRKPIIGRQAVLVASPNGPIFGFAKVRPEGAADNELYRFDESGKKTEMIGPAEGV